MQRGEVLGLMGSKLDRTITFLVVKCLITFLVVKCLRWLAVTAQSK